MIIIKNIWNKAKNDYVCKIYRPNISSAMYETLYF